MLNPTGVSEKVMVSSLSNLNNVFNSNKTASQLAALASFWLDVFADTSEELFKAAVMEVVAHDKYFPKPADVRVHLDNIQRRRSLMDSTEVASRQLEMQTPSKEWVRDLFVKKGLRNPDGSWVDRGKLIAEPYLAMASRRNAIDTGKMNKNGDHIFKVMFPGGSADPFGGLGS